MTFDSITPCIVDTNCGQRHSYSVTVLYSIQYTFSVRYYHVMFSFPLAAPTVFGMPRRHRKFQVLQVLPIPKTIPNPGIKDRQPPKKKHQTVIKNILKHVFQSSHQTSFPPPTEKIAGWRVPRWNTPAPCGSTCRHAARSRACAACHRRTRRRRPRRRPTRHSSGSAPWGWTSEMCWMPPAIDGEGCLVGFLLKVQVMCF